MAPFYFRGGGSASNLSEFYSLCLQKPEDATWHLIEGHIEPWLVSIREKKLAKTTAEIRQDRTSEKGALIAFTEALEKEILGQYFSKSIHFEKTILPETLQSRPKYKVTLDSSGDFSNLEEAIKKVPDGSTLHLQKGVYTIQNGLLIDKSITIIGEGKDATQIAGIEGEFVLKYEGNGLLSLFDLSVDWLCTSCKDADIVFINKGEAHIEHCCFSGAPINTKTNRFGVGLSIKGTVFGTIKESVVQKNGIGIVIGEKAHPLLENNYCQENKECGIYYIDDASGTAQFNNCSKNKHGIAASQQSKPLLENNSCLNNEFSGISIYGTSTAIARKNTCNLNTTFGISVFMQAQPLVEYNLCQQNGHTGIAISGDAQGIIRENTCIQNSVNGISLAEQAQAQVEKNNCKENQQCGIIYAGSAAGTASENICAQNEIAGICLIEQAHPTLVNNTCNENKGDGIKYSAASAGEARQNNCTKNGVSGILISDNAQPLLKENSCLENKVNGIQFTASSGGEARQNTCNKNNEAGIHVAKNAQPTLEENTCQENVQDGIFFSGALGGKAIRNNCIKNGLRGIEVNYQAQPVLENNICKENENFGISIFREARPLLINNDSSVYDGSSYQRYKEEMQKKYKDRSAPRPPSNDHRYNIIPSGMHIPQYREYKEKDYSLIEKIKKMPEQDWANYERRKKNFEESGEREFKQTCASINNLLLTSHYMVLDVIKYQNEARNQLQLAEKEFNARAFSLFWQALENSGNPLEELSFLIYKIDEYKDLYSQRVPAFEEKFDVSNKGNNFPPFFFQPLIPDTSNLFAQYERLLRQGLSDYEFASIWEAIKTRKTIIAGFQSLEHALINGISSLGTLMQDYFVSLSNQIQRNAEDQAFQSRIQNLAIYYGLTKLS